MRKALRIFSFLLCLCAIFGCIPFSVSAKEVTAKIDAVNTSRGAGQLILYTPVFGSRTETNEWGAEAVVGADHKVTAVGGNNSPIPDDGFVVSGHDTEDGSKMKTWVNTNIKVGDYVYFNEFTMEITVSDAPIDVPLKVFYEKTVSFNVLNGYRYENFIVIYNRIGSKTQTNEYGYEVVVTGGMVTSVGGNDSTVPTASGSFVVSGHGTGADWLRSNVIIGMACSFDKDKKTVTFRFDAESMEKGLTFTIGQARKEVETAKKMYRYMDYDAFEAAMKKAESLLSSAVKTYKKDKNESGFAKACNEIKDILNANEVSESYTVQYRGAWLRPSQKNAADVDAYVEKLYRKGINTLCVEGIFNCTVIMNVPSDSLIEHNPDFGFDVLAAYVEACHKRGMECHLWMPIFNVGNFDSKFYSRSLAAKKPDWVSKDETGNSNNPNTFCMIDPANKDARDYLVSFYEYIVKNYDIDCFELDYIRYYDRGEHDYGYTQAAFDGFEQKYHYGVKPKFDTNANYWEDWVQFRKDSISELVKAIDAMIDRTKPNLIIAADVVADPTQAGLFNYQDYLRWEKEGWLDVLKPMAYGDGFDDAIKKQIEMGGDQCAVAVGLGVFMDGLDADTMVRQAIRDNRLNAIGDIYFEATAYLTDKAGEALMQNAYRNPAIPPFLDRDASIKACLTYLNNHIKDVILPLGGMTKEEANAVIAASEAAAGSVKDAMIAPEKLEDLRNAISALELSAAKRAINADLYRAEQITCITYKVDKNQLTELKPGDINPSDVSDVPSESEPGESSAETSGTVSEESDSGSESSEKAPVSEAASNDTDSKDDGDGSVSPFVWVGIGAFVLIAGAVAVLLVRRRK